MKKKCITTNKNPKLRKHFLFTLAFSLLAKYATFPLGNQVCFKLSENFAFFFQFCKDLLIIQL